MNLFQICTEGHRWPSPEDGSGFDHLAVCPICGGPPIHDSSTNEDFLESRQGDLGTLDKAAVSVAARGTIDLPAQSPFDIGHSADRSQPPMPPHGDRGVAPGDATIAFGPDTRAESMRISRGGAGASPDAETVGFAGDATSAEHANRRRTLDLSGTESSDEIEGPLAVLPGYEILSILGRGGMGVVYKARQIGLNRIVALKMILSGGHASPSELRRFRIEAEAVARLQHPNIVQIHDIGEQDGLPYFSLEYVDGGSLQKKLDGKPLPPIQAAHLLEILTHAMHYAHQQGIVHRDLKPANVLLSEELGVKSEEFNKKQSSPSARPKHSATDRLSTLHSSRLTPKISDFGLAKRLDEDMSQTRTGAVMGTPSYMSPEQAAGQSKKIGPATDIYALGAMLYEFLTGRPPFVSDTILDTLKQVTTEEPLSPTRLHSKVPRDLETICLKCLRKDPARRYATASELAEDLRRFQAGEPILARPTSRVEHAWKWIKRRPAVAAALGIGVIAVVTVLALILSHAGEVQAFNNQLTGLNANLVTENEEKEKARRTADDLRVEEEKARRTADDLRAESEKRELATRRYWYASDMNLAYQAFERSHITRVLELLDRHVPKEKEIDLRGFEWHHLRQLCHSDLATFPLHDREIRCIAVSKDGKMMATGGEDRTVRVTNPKTGDALHIITEFTHPISAVDFAPKGDRLLVATTLGELCVYATDGWKRIAELKGGHKAKLGINAAVWSPDGVHIASAGADGAVILWSTSKEESKTLTTLPQGARSLAFDSEGKQLAAGGYTGAIETFTAADGKLDRQFKEREQPLLALAFDPKSGRLISGAADGRIMIWDASKPADSIVLQGPASIVMALRITPDGKTLIAAHADSSIRIWNLAEKKEQFVLRGHRDMVAGLVLSAEGDLLWSASLDGTVKRWDPNKPPAEIRKAAHVGQLTGMVFSPKEAIFATAGFDGHIKLWNAKDGSWIADLKGHTGQIRGVAFDSTGQWLVSGGADKTIRIWDVANRKETGKIDKHTQPVEAVAWSRDGRWIASASFDRTVRVWDAKSLEEKHAFQVHQGYAKAVDFAPDGKTLAVAAHSGQDAVIYLHDLEKAGEARELRGHTKQIAAVAFSPDGRLLASAANDETVRLWNVKEGKEIKKLLGHRRPVAAVAFSEDGRNLYSAGGMVIVWNLFTQEEMSRFEAANQILNAFAVDREGSRLAAGSTTGKFILLCGNRK